MNVVTTKPRRADRIVITARADIAPRKTWRKKTKSLKELELSPPPSVCCCSWRESPRWRKSCLRFQKPGSQTRTPQSHVGNLQGKKSLSQHTYDWEQSPLCSVTLKAGSSVILMLDTSVGSGIHVGSTLSSGSALMLRTCSDVIRYMKGIDTFVICIQLKRLCTPPL